MSIDQTPPIAPPDDETCVVVTTAASAAPVQVWDVVVHRIGEWWAGPYLGPAPATLALEPRLGGQLTSRLEGSLDDQLHGTVRAFDPPRRLEIGGVLVPGAYAGTVTITLDRTALGTEVRIEHMARGRVDAATEDRMSLGWTAMAATLAELADR